MSSLHAARTLWASKGAVFGSGAVSVAGVQALDLAQARAAHAASALRDYVAVPIAPGSAGVGQAATAGSPGAALSPFGTDFTQAIRAAGGVVREWVTTAATWLEKCLWRCAVFAHAHPLPTVAAAVVVLGGAYYVYMRRDDILRVAGWKPRVPAADAEAHPMHAVVPQPPAPVGARPTCPITLEPCLYPCATPDGRVYEFAAIDAWVRENGTCPFTRTPLEHRQLLPLRMEWE